MTVDFQKTRFVWLEQVLKDHDLPPLSFKLAFVISQHMNKGSLTSRPSQDGMAEICGASRNGVRKALEELVRHGHVVVIPGRGRNIRSTYRWVLKDGENGNCSCPYEEEENGNPSGHFDGEKRQPELPVSAADNGNRESEKRQLNRPKRATTVAPNPVEPFLPSVDAGAAAVADLPSAEILPLRPATPPDVRSQLWQDGVQALVTITGKPSGQCKAIIGRWLRDCRDDAKRVLRAIEDARDERAIEPVSWITAALKGGGRRTDTSSDAFVFGRH